MEPQPSLRVRKKERTRLELVRAALELVNGRGYEATTVDDIVDLAEYSRSTFFRYFGSKEDVLFGDIPDRTASFRARLESPDRAGMPWAAARAALTEEILGWTAEAPELQAACVRLWLTEPTLRRRWADFTAQWEDVLADFLDRSLGPEVSPVDARVVATSALGVGRAALAAQVSAGEGVANSLKVGFDLLELGICRHLAAPGAVWG